MDIDIELSIRIRIQYQILNTGVGYGWILTPPNKSKLEYGWILSVPFTPPGYILLMHVNYVCKLRV